VLTHTTLFLRHRRRLLAAVALLAAPAVLIATPGTADAATRNRADAGAGWLGRQLDADTHVMVGQFGADYGLTADVVLALDSAKVGKAAARRATRALSTHVLAYTGGGDATEFYAGSFAKLIVVAAAQGVDPTAFGTGPRNDLVGQLRALECGTRTRTDCPATDDGRFSDRSQFGDFSNPITQSLALIGLERATRRGASPASTSYLLGQQCANGAFPEKFGTTTCAPSVDATGFAVQALTAVGTAKADTAAAAAGRWLKRHQHANGSFTGNGTRNANTTALAAQALTALGRAKAAAKARHFIRSLQVLCGGDPADRGQVRYNRAGTGDPVRATSQAVPALARTTLAEISTDGASRGLPRLAC
jgi:hypothetical protein